MAQTFDTRYGSRVDIKFNIRDQFYLQFEVTDQAGNAVDLSAKDLTFSIRATENGDAVETVTKTTGIVVSGAGNNIVTITKTFTELSNINYYHDLQNTTDKRGIIDGRFDANYKGR